MADLETLTWWADKKHLVLSKAPSVSQTDLEKLQDEGRKRGVPKRKLLTLERKWRKRQGGTALEEVSQKAELEPSPVTTAKPKSTTERPSRK